MLLVNANWMTLSISLRACASCLLRCLTRHVSAIEIGPANPGQPRPGEMIEHALSGNVQDPGDLLTAPRVQLHGGDKPTALVGVGATPSAKAAAVHGMGGIGKTQLVFRAVVSVGAALSHASRMLKE
jgi:hypothetical protein